MPYRRKDSPFWWVSFTDASGKKSQRSTGTTERREADAIEAKCKLEVHRVKTWGEEPSRYFDEMMMRYLQSKQGENRSLERDISTVKRLKSYFGGRDVNRLERCDVMAYIQTRKDQGVKAGTINRELGMLAAAFSFAKRDLCWRIDNPAEQTKLKEPEGRVRFLSTDEAQALITAAAFEVRAPHLQNFISLAINTGCRKSELLKSRWENVDFEQATLRIEGKDSKSGKRRGVPLNLAALQAFRNQKVFIDEYAPSSPWVFSRKSGERIQSVQTSFETACRRAGITDFRVHDLRHTCASWLVTDGVSLAEVRDVLGHSTIKMTERYAHLAPENLRKAVAVLENRLRFDYAQGDGNVSKAS